MSLKLTNNATALLATSIDALATNLAISTADAGKFPALGAGDWCPIVLSDASGNREIMRCTARAGVNLTVVRAAEGPPYPPVARAFTAGARVEVRLTTQAINEMNADPTLLAPPGTIPDSVLPIRLQPVPQVATDADIITVTGRYTTTLATLNIPAPAELGYLWADVYDATMQYQEWQDADSTKRWARRKFTNVWGAWYELFIAEKKIPPGGMMDYGGLVEPEGWYWCNGAAKVRAAPNADLFANIAPVAGVVTISIANPAVIALVAHDFKVGDRVSFEPTAALPAPLARGVNYFVSVATANNFQVSLTSGGASISTVGGSQSGVHTARRTPYGCGDGLVTFNMPDYRGRVSAGKDDMGGNSANRLIGTVSGLNGDVLGAGGGAETVTLTELQMPSHDHTMVAGAGVHDHDVVRGTGTGGALTFMAANNNFTGSSSQANATSDDGAHIHDINDAGGDDPHSNVQPTLISNKIIKY